MTNGKLYLIPTIISDDTQSVVIPPQIRDTLPLIEHFLVENIRTARRYLSSLKIYPSIEPLQFEVLDKTTPESDLKKFFDPIFQGKPIGIISESGCPGVADPGAIAVHFAHKNNIKVVPLVGPSSILLALMASGLNGQRFAFHGYLPIDQKELQHSIKALEKESKANNQTQIFIETPYRNNNMLKTLLQVLHPATLLTVAIDLTGKEEVINTQPVASWKKNLPILSKTPAVFLFLSC